jgi:hypothetical protein
MRATVALWPWSLQRDLLKASGVKTAVAWYCIAVGVLLAGWWAMICGEVRGTGATGPTASSGFTSRESP